MNDRLIEFMNKYCNVDYIHSDTFIKKYIEPHLPYVKFGDCQYRINKYLDDNNKLPFEQWEDGLLLLMEEMKIIKQQIKELEYKDASNA